MVYYTQLIYLKPGAAEAFHRFEDQVLPLLEKHNGRMLLRWRRTDEGVVDTAIGDPYEVHLVSFATASDFRSYMEDDARKTVRHLKDESVDRVWLIEGSRI